jgi:glutamate racemase
MARIVVFDSGLGSLSIINRMQKEFKSEIIYFADQANYPYGQKSHRVLEKIILGTIQKLDRVFEPSLVVIASNTPSLLLQGILKKNPHTILVLPPIKKAESLSQKRICILATKTVVNSRIFKKFLNDNCSDKRKIVTINASPLVDLVESGYIFNKKDYCKKIITKELSNKFKKYDIDVATLSSTHLPFLLPYLEELYPDVQFLDPAKDIACIISKKLIDFPKRNKLQIFTSGNPTSFQETLKKLKIKSKVKKFPIT